MKRKLGVKKMPIVTHEDEKILSNLEIEIAKMMTDISSKERSISQQEIKLADSYRDYCQFLGKFVRKLRDLGKQIEILSREERSGITKEDVEFNKSFVSAIDSTIEVKEKYYDKLKDLATQKKSLQDKRDEYAAILVETAKIRIKIVEVGLKIEEAKNKMVPAEKISTNETKLKDLEREFERTKKDLAKKWEQYEKEIEEVNNMWKAFKEAIDKEGME